MRGSRRCTGLHRHQDALRLYAADQPQGREQGTPGRHHRNHRPCGFSVAPALPGKVDLLKDYLSPSAPWPPFKETRFPNYLDTFPATSVNAGMLVGHNTLRLMVMGMESRVPTADEMTAMVALLEHGLKAGALGMSSGLFTPPGSYAAPAR